VFRTTVLKTAARIRKSEETLLDHDYLLRHASESELSWGLSSEWSGGSRIHFADRARTVIDVLDAPDLAGGIRHAADILGAYLDEHDSRTLVEYGDRLGNRTVFKRLGYLTEVLGRNLPDLTTACRERISEGISPLDPDGPKGGRRAMRWHLRVNVTLKPESPT
jgi:predicted transcriptional regulator of viral defense system